MSSARRFDCRAARLWTCDRRPPAAAPDWTSFMRRAYGEGSRHHAAAPLELRPEPIRPGAGKQHLEDHAGSGAVRDLHHGMTVHGGLQIAADDEQMRGSSEKRLEVRNRRAGARIADLEREQLLAAGDGLRRV